MLGALAYRLRSVVVVVCVCGVCGFRVLIHPFNPLKGTTCRTKKFSFLAVRAIPDFLGKRF